MGGLLPFVCPNQTPLLSSSGLTEDFQQLLFTGLYSWSYHIGTAPSSHTPHQHVQMSIPPYACTHANCLREYTYIQTQTNYTSQLLASAKIHQFGKNLQTQFNLQMNNDTLPYLVSKCHF